MKPIGLCVVATTPKHFGKRPKPLTYSLDVCVIGNSGLPKLWSRLGIYELGGLT